MFHQSIDGASMVFRPRKPPDVDFTQKTLAADASLYRDQTDLMDRASCVQIISSIHYENQCAVMHHSHNSKRGSHKSCDNHVTGNKSDQSEIINQT